MLKDGMDLRRGLWKRHRVRAEKLRKRVQQAPWVWAMNDHTFKEYTQNLFTHKRVVPRVQDHKERVEVRGVMRRIPQLVRSGAEHQIMAFWLHLRQHGMVEFDQGIADRATSQHVVGALQCSVCRVQHGRIDQHFVVVRVCTAGQDKGSCDVMACACGPWCAAHKLVQALQQHGSSRGAQQDSSCIILHSRHELGVWPSHEAQARAEGIRHADSSWVGTENEIAHLDADGWNGITETLVVLSEVFGEVVQENEE